MNSLISTLITALVGFLSAIIGGLYATRTEKQVTARIVFENAYHEIFELIEDKFYDKSLSDDEIAELGKNIYSILQKSNGYYYPSLKKYALWMFNGEYNDNLQELWHSFSWTFDRQYEKVTSLIGIPPRSRYYRMNTKQYSSFFHLIRIYFLSKHGTIELLLILIGLLLTLNYFTN
ncbi:hypothetical protein [Ligilactobacillus salivarius]|uniref:hypothetical protein n=1 Tax=Ligilactobacillus salivarius TaxID=1624 RepID=UPI00235EC4AC|nr:hypothetical protein [Ligilactobacillus salivarius]MDD1403524.1 hypothetical protein [Ligilactobacillus salivarius]MDW3022567.1 hypothetical protein [Ligilactobacillus salivarius]